MIYSQKYLKNLLTETSYMQMFHVLILEHYQHESEFTLLVICFI